MFRPKFVKFLMSILKWQVNFISNFASFFIVITLNSTSSFKLIHFLRCVKESNESPNFENFVCSDEDLPNSSCHFPNCTQTLYTLVKSSPFKYKFLKLSSSRVKICQIPYVNFETTSQFLFRFFIILQCHYL